MYGEFDPSAEHLKRLQKIADGYTINVARTEEEEATLLCDRLFTDLTW